MPLACEVCSGKSCLQCVNSDEVQLARITSTMIGPNSDELVDPTAANCGELIDEDGDGLLLTQGLDSSLLFLATKDPAEMTPAQRLLLAGS